MSSGEDNVDQSNVHKTVKQTNCGNFT